MVKPQRWAAQSPMSDPAEHETRSSDCPDRSIPCAASSRGLPHPLRLASLVRDRRRLPFSGSDDAAACGAASARCSKSTRLRSTARVRPHRARSRPVSRLCAHAGVFPQDQDGSRPACGADASCLGPGWEDHWVCEYWDASRRWRLADPQIDEILREGSSESVSSRPMFRNPCSLPPARRGGAFEPGNSRGAGCFGHGQTKGLWFMRVNVARDHLALNGVEVSRWDNWRQATGKQRLVNEADSPAVDRIAASPDRAFWASSQVWTA